MQFPDISPIAFEIGPLVIRWYALAYVVGILLAQHYVSWLDRRPVPPLNADAPRPPSLQGRGKGRVAMLPHIPMAKSSRAVATPTHPSPFLEEGLRRPILTEKAQDDLILYGVLGIVLGGRVGYVLFYNLPHYLSHPQDILAIWHGGMSFHGGLLGILIAFWFFCRRHQLRWLALMDLFACAAPIGLFLGRCANFVNGELYGRVTDASWGMVFPNGGDLPRHPSQLYEAGLEGLLLGLILFLLATRTRALHYTGLLGGVFIGGYGIARFIVEFFREPDAQLGFLTFGLSMGQWLCMPMIAAGLWLALRAKKTA